MTQDLYKQMRDLAGRMDVTIITAKAPPRWEPDLKGGIRVLDYLDILKPSGGVRRGELTVISAKTSAGKSLLSEASCGAR
ncbi:hypothetical protein [Xanthomonas phage BUDD]|nr:hypothetical protein [Xanthomonas phage BUDD]